MFYYGFYAKKKIFPGETLVPNCLFLHGHIENEILKINVPDDFR